MSSMYGREMRISAPGDYEVTLNDVLLNAMPAIIEVAYWAKDGGQDQPYYVRHCPQWGRARLPQIGFAGVLDPRTPLIARVSILGSAKEEAQP